MGKAQEAMSINCYGYNDDGTPMVSIAQQVESRQTRKDVEQDAKIQQNYEDNVKQQGEINAVSGDTSSQEASISELWSVVENLTGGVMVDINLSVAPNAAVSENTISFSLVSAGSPVMADVVKLDKSIDGGNASEIGSWSGVTSGTTTSEITGAIENYSLRVIVKGEGGKQSVAISEKTMYAYYVGATATATATDSLVNELTKKLNDNIDFNITVSTSDNTYMWFVLPASINVRYIASDSIPVTLDNAAGTSILSGKYKAYRSKNMLMAATWQPTIVCEI